MKTVSNYQIAKNTLKTVSLDVNSEYRNDKPMIRQFINDTLDSIIRDLNLSDYQSNLLSNYACKLHPKD